MVCLYLKSVKAGLTQHDQFQDILQNVFDHKRVKGYLEVARVFLRLGEWSDQGLCVEGGV